MHTNLKPYYLHKVYRAQILDNMEYQCVATMVELQVMACTGLVRHNYLSSMWVLELSS